MTETIAVERSIVVHADRERVWRAITDSAQISQWFDGNMRWEFQLGVGEHINYYYNGALLGTGRIVTIEPPERFVLNWTAEPGSPVETLVTFALETVDGGTRVTVTESGFEALPEDRRHARAEDNSDGWRQVLEHLQAYLQAADHA